MINRDNQNRIHKKNKSQTKPVVNLWVSLSRRYPAYLSAGFLFGDLFEVIIYDKN